MELEESDIVLLMMGANDLLMHDNINPIDFVNTQRNFIKSIFNLKIQHVIVSNLFPVQLTPEFKPYFATLNSEQRQKRIDNENKINEMIIHMVEDFKHEGYDLVL